MIIDGIYLNCISTFFNLNQLSIARSDRFIRSNPLLNIICAPDAELSAVSLYSVCGQLVYITIPVVSENHIKLDLQGLPSGVYFVEIRTGNGVVTRKVVVR